MDSQSRATEQAPYEIDVAPDGDRWRYRKRWRQGGGDDRGYLPGR